MGWKSRVTSADDDSIDRTRRAGKNGKRAFSPPDEDYDGVTGFLVARAASLRVRRAKNATSYELYVPSAPTLVAARIHSMDIAGENEMALESLSDAVSALTYRRAPLDCDFLDRK